MEYISKSEKDTIKFAKKFASTLKSGDVFLLDGDLGAGKTVFVKGVIEALGGDKNQVTSPTFTIVNRYQIKDKTVNHFDLYRLKSVNELFNIGFDEYIYSDDISFIEWPDRAGEYFDKSAKRIKITKIDDCKRKIEIID